MMEVVLELFALAIETLLSPLFDWIEPRNVGGLGYLGDRPDRDV